MRRLLLEVLFHLQLSSQKSTYHVLCTLLIYDLLSCFENFSFYLLDFFSSQYTNYLLIYFADMSLTLVFLVYAFVLYSCSFAFFCIHFCITRFLSKVHADENKKKGIFAPKYTFQILNSLYHRMTKLLRGYK